MPEKTKIMVVDDDHDTVAGIKIALETLGLEVIPCYDGLSALEIFEKERPPIVILDLMIPRRGGFQVLIKWKGTPKHKGKLPIVIMITGNEGERHRHFAEILGSDEYIRKPFAITLLLEAVSRYLEKLPTLSWVEKYAHKQEPERKQVKEPPTKKSLFIKALIILVVLALLTVMLRNILWALGLSPI